MKVFFLCFMIVLGSSFTTRHISYSSFTDKRDGQTYKTIKIGNAVWMAENLNYATRNSVVANNAKQYGRLYSIEEAKEACPVGWHLPTDSEWKALEKQLGVPFNDLNLESTPRGEEIAGTMKNEMGWKSESGVKSPTNESGFSALPAGFYLTEEKQLVGLGILACFWTSTQENDAIDKQLFSTVDYKNKAYSWMRILDSRHNDIARHYFSGKDNYYSVRCVKNKDSENRIQINGVSIEVPDNWTFEEKAYKTIFLKLRAPKNSKDVFTPFVNFTKKEKKEISLESYYTSYVESLRSNKGYSSFQLLSREEETIGTLSGVRFTFSVQFADSDIKIKSAIVLLVDDNYRYSIDYTASPNDFDRYLKAFKQIVQSFSNSPELNY